MRNLRSSTHLKSWFLTVLTFFFMFLVLSGAAFALTGDLDNDGDVDRDDLTVLLAHRNQPASVCPECDLDGDGTITVLDARKLVLQCTLPRCAIVSHENQPPVADAGQDITLALPAGQTTVDVQLDGSQSSDPDGRVTGYTWTGTPDPADASQPTLALSPGRYTFSLMVTDDDNALSPPDDVVVTVLGIPEVVSVPRATGESTVMIRGRTVPGVNVIIQGGAEEATGAASTETGYFQVPVTLTSGENDLLVSGEWQGVNSEPAEVNVNQVAPTISLDTVTPEPGSAGSIVELSGSGFTPDKKVMGVYFKGAEQEGQGLVLEATETFMKAVVPFVFLNTDEQIQVYVYDDSARSNALGFNIVPCADPTPGEAGNEMSSQFDLLIVQINEILSKMEQLVKPNISAEKWEVLEENFGRLQTFVEDGRSRMLTIHDEQTLSNLDRVFGSEILELVQQKLAHINELISHSPTGEAICELAEADHVLNEVIDILDWVDNALIAADVICFFVCQPALPVIETVRQIVETVLDVLEIVRDILNAAAPTHAEPTKWHIEVAGPYPGVDPHVLFTNSSNRISLYTDFSNGNLNNIVGRISTVGGVVLDLLGIDLGHFAVHDVKVPSTISIHSIDPSNLYDTPSSSPLFSILGQSGDDLASMDTHTLETYGLPGDLKIVSAELDIRSSCSNYSYPEGYVGGGPFENPPAYPEFFSVLLIKAPIVNGMDWDEEYSGWYVWGLGFSEDCGSVFKILWNGEEVPCDCIDSLDYNSFIATCTYFHEPGRLEVVLVDPTDPNNEEKQRRGPTQHVGLNPDESLTVTNVIPSSGFIGDEITVVGDHFSPYPEDMTIYLYPDNDVTKAVQVPVLSVAADWMPGVLDSLTFKVPEELHGYEGNTIPFRVYLTADISYGSVYDSSEFSLRLSESAAWADQDLIAFGKPHGYVRSALVGDITGDGVNDLIVGVAEDQAGLGRINGSVFIAFGPIEGEGLPTGQQYIDLDIAALPTHWDVVISGDYQNGYLDGNFCRRIGNSLAMGDINGDGINDLVIGTTDQNDEGLHDLNTSSYDGNKGHLPGKAYVFYGRPIEEWNKWYDIPSGEYDVVIHGDDQRELGSQVAVGNLNGDAYADMVISAPSQLFNPNKPDLDWSGRAYVIFGSDGLPGDMDVGDIPSSVTGAMVVGESVNQEYAYKGDGLAEGITLGDINGDGLDDLLVGAPFFLRTYQGYTRKGAAYLYYGRGSFGGDDGILSSALYDGEQDVLLLGPTPLDSPHDMHPGWEIGRVMAIADLNNDGKGEVVLGSPDEFLDYEYTYGNATLSVHEDHIGLVSVLPGDLFPQTGVSMYNTLTRAKIYGSTVLSRFGASLAIADVNSDEKKDLLVGAPGRVGSDEPGAVWGFYGSGALPSGTIHLTDRSGVPDDFLIKGDQAHTDSPQGFGTFITAGDLNPFVGDDVLVIDPMAKAPEPSDPTHQTWRDYSGMLYVFYEGAKELWPLSIYPENTIMDSCNSEQFFRAYGGQKPYLFAWGTPDVPEEVELNTEYGSRTAQIRINGCVPEGFASLRLRVFDADGREAASDISFNPLPVLGLHPNSYDFGPAGTGLTITVSNPGGSILEWSVRDTLPAWLTLSQMAGSLSSGESIDISATVDRSGLSAGEYTYSILVDTPVSSDAVHLTMAVEPDISASPSSLDMGDVEVGWSRNQSITITNAGSRLLSLFNISLGGTSDFTFTENCPDVLFPGVSCDVTVTFHPDSEGEKSASLNIASNDPDEGTKNIPLTGNGIVSQVPDIVVIGGNLVFSDVPTGSSRSQDIIIHNGGNADLEIGNISLSGAEGFSLTENNCTGTLAPYTSTNPVTCSLTVAFAPSATEPVYGTIAISSNDPDTPRFEGSLSGNGIAPFISVSPESIDFGETGTNSLLTIQNTGSSGNLNWSITDDLPAWLTISQMSGEVGSGVVEHLTVTIHRGGLPPGTYTHTLLVTSNGGDKAVGVTMVVPVPAPSLAVSPESVEMDPSGDAQVFIASGGESPYTFELFPPEGEAALPDVVGFEAVDPDSVQVTIGSCDIATDTDVVPADIELSLVDSEPDVTVTSYSIEVTEPLYTESFLVPEVHSQCGVSPLTLKVTDQENAEAEAQIDFAPGSLPWAKTYSYGGVNENETLSSLNKTSDGGYIVSGSSYLNDDPGWHFWVMKLDGAGKIEWQKLFAGVASIAGEASTVIESFDDNGAPDGYVFAGTAYLDQNEKIWVIKMNGVGSVQWQKSYEADEGDLFVNTLKQAPDIGFVMAGEISENGTFIERMFLLKIGPNGNFSWAKGYRMQGVDNDDIGEDLDLTDDGGMVMVGYSMSVATEYAVVLKLDESGNILWKKAFQDPDVGGVLRGYSIRQTFGSGGLPDGYVVAGVREVSSGGGELPPLDGGGDGDGEPGGTVSTHLLVVRLDTAGAVLWNKDFEAFNGEPAVRQTPDGGFIVAGATDTADIRLVKLRSDGTVDWQRALGGPDAEWLAGRPDCLEVTDDGSYVTGGMSWSGGSPDAWLLKVFP